jgi:hypothetical protein
MQKIPLSWLDDFYPGRSADIGFRNSKRLYQKRMMRS